MDIDPLEQELRSIYFTESEEMLFHAEAKLLSDENSSDLLNAINVVFRAVHSIKGGAQSLEFDILAQTAHKGEDFLAMLRQQTEWSNNSTVSLLLRFIDILKSQLNSYKENRPLTALDKPTVSLLHEFSLYQPLPEEVTPPDTLHLFYLAAAISPSSPMPKAHAALFTELLRDSGQVIYDHFIVETNQATAVLLTSLAFSEIETKLLSLIDTDIVKLIPLDHTCSQIKTPTLTEIDLFNTHVFELQDSLSILADKASVLNKVEAITSWGLTESSALEWFPGGVPAWDRLLNLLHNSVDIELQHQDKKPAMVSIKIVQVLWETVFSSLCDHSYFRSITLTNLVNNWNFHLNSLLDNVRNTRMVLVDFNQSPVLESNVLKSFFKLRSVLSPKGISVYAISNGDYTRSHLNILEATGSITGGISLYSSPYHAAMQPKNYYKLEVT